MSQATLKIILFLLIFGVYSSPLFSKEISKEISKETKSATKTSPVSQSSSKASAKPAKFSQAARTTSKSSSKSSGFSKATRHKPESVYERYDFSDEEESTSFFGNFFSDEPGDPVDFSEYYKTARMAFLFGYYDTASQYWQPMANLGHAKSQASIAWMYQSGKGFKQNYKRAFEWYTKAAKQNQPIAQNNLGVLYEKGWGTTKNLSQAVKWYRESAEWGYSYGQFNYGQMLIKGRGIKKNISKATYWLDLASLQGVKQADGLLGRSLSSSASKHIADNSDKPTYSLKKKIWILLKNPRYFTLQLMQGNSKKDIIKYIERTNATGQFAYFITEKRGKKIYNLIYGVFTSYTLAEQSMRALPPKMLKRPPWIRKFRNIQKHIKK